MSRRSDQSAGETSSVEQSASKLANTIVVRFKNPKDFAEAALSITAGNLSDGVTQSHARRLFSKLYKSADALSISEERFGFALYVRDEERLGEREKNRQKDRAVYDGIMANVVKAISPHDSVQGAVIDGFRRQIIQARRPLGL